jgi:uncharacterized protein YbdZ (MbtH family)
MLEVREIRDAMLRLSCIGRTQYYYDPAGQVFGDGPIHYLVEVDGMLFMAWENNEIGNMIVNPITRFDLNELEELGAEEGWTVLRVPTGRAECIQFLEINKATLREAYYRMEGSKIATCGSPVPPSF